MADKTSNTPPDPAGSLHFKVVGSPPEILTKRGQFLRVAQGRRVAMPGFILQGRPRAHDDGKPPRTGYTCSKKVGNAVARNRAKRRLREVARHVIPNVGKPGWDYVLVGRREATASLSLSQLVQDLDRALGKLHK